jgi:pyochelin biosynthesis protein PchG
MQHRPNAVVFGTTFGQVYVDALCLPHSPYQLNGIAAKGGARSRGLAAQHGVGFITAGQPLPGNTRLACVVVRSGLLGGPGSEIVQYCLTHGLDVVQEHPVHLRELTQHVRTARQHGASYYLNTFYDGLPVVRAFGQRAQALIAQRQALHLELRSSYQAAWGALDLLSQLAPISTLRLHAAAPQVAPQPAVQPDVPAWRRLSGHMTDSLPSLGLQVDVTLDPLDPDNHPHLLVRAELFCRTGTLLLADVHGPVLWLPRPHVPSGSHAQATAESQFSVICEAFEGSFSDGVRTLWPEAVNHLLTQVAAQHKSTAWLERAQRHLDLCSAWTLVSSQLGLPQLSPRTAHEGRT